jgi:FAD/FMN-containing dehydrogenase
LAADWPALQAAIDGDVVLAASPAYERARKPFFAQFHDSHPEAVVFCSSTSDVVEVLRFANRSGVWPRTRSGGHCFAGRSAGDGLVIDVSPMRSVEVVDGSASIGSGARLGELYEALGRADMTIPGGSCPSVGIAGLTLGGGLGILGRMFGLTSDSLESAEIVLADGRIVECDARHDADLFWALRGGGAGSFGVVTRLQLRTRPTLPATNFRLSWSHQHAARLIHAWQQWAPVAPDELYVALLVSAAGDPERPFSVQLVGSDFGSESEAARRLDEFITRCGADPSSEARRHASFRDTTRFWAGLDTSSEANLNGDPQAPQSAHVYLKSEFFRQPLPSKAIASLVANFATPRAAGEERELDFTPWGGGYNRVAADATAFAHRAELFSLKHTLTLDPNGSSAADESARRWLGHSWSCVRPWGSGRVFPSFPDPDLDDPGRAYYAGNYERLLRVKNRYDPDNAFPPVA